MKIKTCIHSRNITWISCFLSGLFATTPLYAHPQHKAENISDLGAIEVTGRASDLLGQTNAASSGMIGQAEFEFRPLSRPGELVEVVPGMVATQHSGSGKANQYFLRGFNLDHGTDFSAMIDGVPLNLPTHGHGQGYLDLNSIIPELVEVIEFGKGPYHAKMGDFSSAGYVKFHTKHQMERGLAKLGIGENGYYRGVLADSYQIADGHLLFGAEINFYDGPWLRDENLNKFNALIRYTVDEGDRGYAFVATTYHSSWDATEQIPKRAVEQQGFPVLGTIDDTIGGNMERYSLSANWWRQSEHGETRLSSYAVYSDFNLYSNFTYFLDNPIHGDQITQQDRRYIVGGEAVHTQYENWFELDVKNIVGLQIRHDYIPHVALHKSQGRTLLRTVSEHKVKQTSIAVYGENEVQWTKKFKSIVGLRGDFYFYDVTSQLLPANSGETSDAQLSPKLSFVLGPWQRTEYYLNMGRGFHSNDARGTTIKFDPESGDPAKTVDPLVSTLGAEIGLRTQYISGLVSTLSLWWLELDSELVFVGDAGGTEPSSKSQRYGVELSNFYKPSHWLTLDFDVALTQSEFIGVPANEKEIPNSVGTTVSSGVTVDLPNGLFASLQARYFGDMPLTEDGSVFADSTTIVNLGAGYRYKNFRFEVNVFNLFDSTDKDITYFYESRLDGEAAGIEDVHFHPVEPRAIRLQASMRF